jgi:2-oxoglutarate dehydrogenase E2 component (dihydrolipoamide succinyltransferase)
MSRMVPVLAPSEQSEGTQLQVLRWLKPVGAVVVENEPLIEIETDKVTVEVPAPVGGVLREILRNANDEVSPGELLGRIEADATAMGQAPADRTASPGHGTDSNAAERGPARREGASVAASSSGSAAATSGSAKALLSPAVRRLLSQHGLDPEHVTGTGAGGRITVDDVLGHAARGVQPSGASGASQGALAAGAEKRSRTGGAETPVRASEATARDDVHRVPHSSMRKRIAERMVESLLHTAPHVTTLFDVDMTAVLEHRARHRADFANRGVALTLTPYFLRACVAAIRAVPEVNARWTDDALEIYDTIDIGVGTALEGKGLVVPIVRSVQSLELFGIARELGELVARARDDKLTPTDVRGGTFTISNHGVSGSLLAAPIVINQPQSAILGIGKLEKRPVVVERDGDDVIEVQPRCYVTLTIDHRVMDGHRANRFLEVLVRELESGNY